MYITENIKTVHNLEDISHGDMRLPVEIRRLLRYGILFARMEAA